MLKESEVQKKSLASPGKKVSFTRRNGATVNGVVSAIESKGNGTWVAVNTASGRKAAPIISRVRESQLRAAA